MNKIIPTTRRKLLKTAAAGGMLGILSSMTAPAYAKSKIRWRMGMAWSKNAPGYTTPVIALADFVNKASNGDFQIEVFGSGEIVPGSQTFDAVLDKVLDCGHGYPSYWAGKLPAMNLVMAMPFGTTAQEKSAWLQYGGGQELLDKVYGKLGMKFFPLGNCGIQPMGWFRKEITSLDSLKGLKFRVSGLGGKVLSECGVAIVGLPIGEVLQALQSGTLDATELTGPYVDSSLGVQRVAKNYYFPGWHEPEGQFDMFINLDAWKKLPAQYKELVRVGAYYANNIMLSEMVAKNGKSFEELRVRDGVQARVLPPDVLKRLYEITNDILASGYGSDPLFREVRDSLQGFLKHAAPYSELSEMLYMQTRATLSGRKATGI